MDKKIETYLCEFGLSRKEIKIYLALLEQGRSSVLDISKKTGIKRSTAHNYIEKLITKGIISQTSQGSRRMLVAELPEKLQSLLNQKKWELKRLQNKLPKVVKNLYSIIPEAEQNNEVEIKYYEGKKGVKLIYEEALSSRELRSYVNLNEVLKIFPDNGDLFIEALRKNQELKIWEIMEKSNISEEFTPQFSQSKRYQFRFTPTSIKLSAVDILMFDRKVGIINVRENLSGLVISNKDYFGNSKAIFDFVWNML